MAATRTAEDLLRDEYRQLLPGMQRALTEVETEVKHALLPLTLSLHPYEWIIVRARLKECESAVEAVRRRTLYGHFDPDTLYSLKSLPDLVGIRVLTFPSQRLADVHRVILPRIAQWTSDPVLGTDREREPVALKYTGFWQSAHPVRSEIQIVSLLIGLFWEVEHSAIYKPSPELRGVAESLEMKRKTAAVETALKEFEGEFGRSIEGTNGPLSEPSDS